MIIIIDLIICYTNDNNPRLSTNATSRPYGRTTKEKRHLIIMSWYRWWDVSWPCHGLRLYLYITYVKDRKEIKKLDLNYYWYVHYHHVLLMG